MMNTLDIENLEYILSEIDKAKEHWSKTDDSTIFKVKKHFSRGLMLFLYNTLKLSSVIKVLHAGNGNQDYVLFFKKEGIDIVLERINDYLFSAQNEYYL